jgi:hypothetical protein
MKRLDKYNKTEYFVAEVTPDDYWAHETCATEEEAKEKLIELKETFHKIREWAIIKRETVLTIV